MTSLFPEGSVQPVSKVLPSVWEDWDEFVELAEQLELRAEGLKLSADVGLAASQADQAASMMGGGMMAAVHLAERLDLPVVVDYLHVTRYRGGTRGGKEVAELGVAFRAEKGETVVTQDGEPRSVFFVTSGTADAFVAVPELSASRPLLVGTFARGDAFGHLEFFLEDIPFLAGYRHA